MKTIERIFKHLNEEKVELKSERIELSNVKELAALIKSSRPDMSQMVDSYVDARENCRKGIRAAQEHLKNVQKVNNVLNDIKNIAQDLGVNVGKIKEYRQGFDFIQANPEAATKNMIKKMQGLL
tara:strand:+ start:813 stop:1184 length:372 start_codon:yes stop_codon:yes gene_type:complete